MAFNNPSPVGVSTASVLTMPGARNRRIKYLIRAPLAALLGMCFACEAHAEPMTSAEIHIESAIYGGAMAGTNCSARTSVSERCESKMHCLIPIDRTLCLLDDSNKSVLVQRLIVHYHCGDGHKIRMKQADQPGTISVSCIMP